MALAWQVACGSVTTVRSNRAGCSTHPNSPPLSLQSGLAAPFGALTHIVFCLWMSLSCQTPSGAFERLRARTRAVAPGEKSCSRKLGSVFAVGWGKTRAAGSHGTEGSSPCPLPPRCSLLLLSFPCPVLGAGRAAGRSRCSGCLWLHLLPAGASLQIPLLRCPPSPREAVPFPSLAQQHLGPDFK